MKEIEIISKRKPNEKHFLREDGTFVARVYNGNIHYQKNGKYEEIDNSLVKRNGYYQNRKNDYKVSFKENTNDSFLKMEKDNYYLELKLKEAKEVKAKKVRRKPEIAYPNILEGVDIEYQTLPTKVKETIILQNEEASRKKFSFLVNTNLTLSLEHNTILAKNQNEVIFVVDPPYMEDSNGKISHDVFYSLEEKDGSYEIQLQLDYEWLTFGNVKYPVRIDPTITNMSQGGNVYDTYIYPGDTGVDRNSHNILKAGVEKIGGDYRTNRTLIKFDLPQIGTGSEVIDAELSLLCYPISHSVDYVDNKVLTIHRITTDWNEETANWENMNSNYSNRIESTILASRSISAGNIIQVPKYASAYLTNLVKKWYTGTPNYGIMLKSCEEIYIDEGYPAFFSKSTNIEGIDVKPFLEITYRNQNGLEGYLNYQSQSLAQGTTYVNTYNGNLTGVWNLGNTIGGKYPVSVGLVYNTNDVILNQNTIYGKGYKLTLDQTIKEVVIDNYNYLEYVDEDGTIHYFYEKKTEDETLYQDEDGLSLTVRKDNNQYQMTDKNGNQMIFVKSGDFAYLQSQVDVKKNIISIERNSNHQITKIVDANRAEINFYYEPNRIRIVSPDVTTELIYSNGNLVAIKDSQGTSHITYNSNYLITEIVDVTGLKLNYAYYSQKPYKIQKVSQYGLNNEMGEYFTLEYGFETTTITDYKGRTNTLIFNDLGNLLSSNSMKAGKDLNEAYSTVSDYGSESNHKNKLLANTIPVRHVKNYIKNSSFETDEDLFIGDYYNLEKSYSTECSVSGYRSLKFKISKVGQHVESKKLILPKGKYYTLSGYFKNEQKIKLSIVRYDAKHELIQNSIEIEPSDEFLRHDITFYHEGQFDNQIWIDMKFEDVGTAYMDNVQLEEGEVVNDYNIIENSDFSEGLSGWNLTATRSNYTQLDEVGLPTEQSIPVSNVFEVVTVNNQNTALKIKMDPLEMSSLEKRFPIKGKKGDIYTVSFWYKNEGIQSDGNMIVNNVTIYFKPVGKEADYCVLPSTEFHPNENQWQYFTFRYDADEDYEEIRLIFHQGGNAHDFYITNIAFYKDVASSFYDYDEDGNVTSIKESSKEESNTFGYDSNNQLISATTPKGKNFKYEYDNLKTDQVLSAISSMGVSNQVEYDSFGNPILTRISKKLNEELKDGLYFIRSKGTDKYLNVKNDTISMENDFCSNTIWKLEKREEDRITTEVSDDGEEHQIVEKVNVAKLFHSVLSETSLGYLNHQLFLTKDNQNNEFTLKENKNGSYSLKAGEEYLKLNDSNLELASYIENDSAFEFYFELPDEEFIETRATYTEDGRFVTSVTDSNFNKTEYDTDPVTGLTKSMTNAKNQITNYTYNDKKQITSVTQGEKAVNYTYNDKNLLEKIVQGNKEYQFTYDNFLNTKSVSIGDNITLVTNEYEPNNGNLTKTIYGNNQEISFEYDEFDRNKILHKMDKDYHYKYDSNGNVQKILEFNPITTYDTDPQEVEKAYDSMTKYNYDTAKRIEEYQKDGFRIGYSYDKNDNVINKKYKLKDELHTLENAFNKDDQLTQTKLDSQKVNYEYDSLGRIKRKEINDIYQTEYEYVRKGKRTSDLIKSIKNGDDEYSYQYDKLNNITYIFHNNQLLNFYEYDDYNELIKEENYQRNQRIEYIYDNSGNLLTKTIKNLETDDIIKTDTYEYTNSNWEDQLTKFNNQEITYDAIGNPLSIGSSITMEWMNGRSLKSYKNTAKNQEINYKYNKDGIREEKNFNGEITKYYLENNHIIYEQRGNDTIYYLYDLTGLIGLRYQEENYYYIKNLQGDIIGMLDKNYNRIVSYEYDSWGKLLSIKDEQENEITDETNIGIINPFRYREYYYDTETGLYYLNSRYYNPVWGRFLNADGIIGANMDIHSYNLYAYVSNNSINSTDSNGNFAVAGAFGAFGPAGAFGLGVLLGYAAVKTAPAIIQVAKQVVETVVNTVQDIANELTKPRKKQEDNYHNVYVLRNHQTHKVEYVGRTLDLKATEYRHQNNPFRTNLDFEPVARNISSNTARGLEQALIVECRTLNRNREYPINNQINGVSSRNPRYQLYWDSAMMWRSENIFSCS